MSSLKKLPLTILRAYRQDACNQHAAVISFYAIFSLLPLAMLTVTILATLLGGSAEWIQRLDDLIAGILPTASRDMHRILQTAVAKRQQVSLLSAGMLVVLASFLVSSLEHALDRVFRTEKKRNFFHSKILALAFVFVFIFLFAVPGLLGLAQHALIAVGFVSLAQVYALPADTFFFFISFSAFFLAVTIIPHHKVYMRYVWWGALAFTILTGIARLLFRYYIGLSWNRYDFIYDSLAAIIVLIVWIYYLANIFLLCAELVARLQEKRRK